MSVNSDPSTQHSGVTEPEIAANSFVGDLQDEKFYPTGAIAFFIALVLLCLVIWFGIYFIMLDRV